MIDPPQYEKLRVVTVDEEEAAEYEQQLYFEVPRKTGNQMAPRIDVIKHMRKFDQQKKIRILRKMMKRARVPKVGKQTEILLNMDKSEGIVPHGEVSKRIYNEIFHSREFDLYGRPIHRTGPIEYNVRKEKELRNKAFELGIEYKNLKQEEIYKASLADPDKDNVPDIFADNTKDLKKPQISTELWKIGFADTKIAPIGLKEDPGKIYKSRGNEKFFSYDGEWDKGRMHGDGRYKYLDGHEYVGRFQNDWPHGIGTATYPMGGSFRGEWVKGRYGTLEQSSKMEDSTRHEIEKKGSVLETCIGSVYEGEFSFGRRDGKGKITFPSGLIIEGTFLDGQPSGRCKVTSKLTKYSFEGNFNKGYIDGMGTLTTPDNERISRFWHKKNPTDPGLTLSGCVKLYLQDLADEMEEKRTSHSALYALRRGLQLRAYVHGIRTELHETRAAEKRERQNKAMADLKEQKKKLHEARLKALAGDDD